MVAGYKQTEVGMIPVDWDVKTIGDIGEPRMCKRIFSYQTKKNGDIPFYKIGTFGKQPDAFISKEIYDLFRRKYSFPTEGSILISAAGTIGKTIVYNGEDAYYQDSNIVWIDNNHLLISNEYFKHVFPMVRFRTEGGTIQRLYNNILKGGIFPCPPTNAEQTAIATALNDADAIITALEKLIAKKKAIKQGAMQELLKPKAGWEEKNLGKSAILKARIGWQGLTTAEYKDTGKYFLITGTDFKNGFIDWQNCVYVEKIRYDQDKYIQSKPNDVLVTKDGTIGKVAFVSEVPKPATLNSGVFVIRPIGDSFHPEFFYYILLSEHFTKFLGQLSAGSTINHLYQKDFVSFDFWVPKTINEQKEISRILSDMDSEITALEQKLEKQKQIKQGMMQVLLTGKVRLV